MLDGGHALSSVLDCPATMSNLTTGEPAHLSNQALYEPFPDSQQSSLSVQLNAHAAPNLLPSSSDASNATVPDTDLTSPISSNEQQRQAPDTDATRLLLASPTQPPAPRVNTVIPLQTGDTAASPMSLDRPALTQGSKRTASGMVKTNGSVNHYPPPMATATVSHKRHISVDSAISSAHIGQLSAQLRTRLSYAMVKVQNGWEKRSIEELEELPSGKGSSLSTPALGEGYRNGLSSPGRLVGQRRPSALSENSDDRMPLSVRSSPSQLAQPAASAPNGSLTARFGDHTQDHWSVPPKQGDIKANGPKLAPAAEIGSRRKRRSSTARAPPPLLSSSQRQYYSDLGASPRTPTATPRAGILRMPSQQAEKDAVDTLLFMSSPNNSNRIIPNPSDAQPSPLKTELTPARRVAFDSHSNVQFDMIKATPRGVQAEAEEKRWT